MPESGKFLITGYSALLSSSIAGSVAAESRIFYNAGISNCGTKLPESNEGKKKGEKSYEWNKIE